MLHTFPGIEFGEGCCVVTIGTDELPVLGIEYGTCGIGKARVSSSVARKFLMALRETPENGFGAVVHYKHPDIGYDSDMLGCFRLVSGRMNISATDEAHEIELSFSYKWVAWTNKRIRFDAPVSREISESRSVDA